MKTALFVAGLSVSLFQSKAQTSYPQNYFRTPVDFPVLLAGNFGECRPGHFHSGMDIKTKGVENQAVYAAADGYISRMKIEKGGFGHALYITHPNGYTTLYAHLNDYAAPFQKYLRQQQYQKKRWDVDLQLSPGQFPVKKGQQIAWSGNTGGSTAPHLHFEIRNTQTEHPLNPQQFGFDVKDTQAPTPARLGLYDGTRSIYEQKPGIFSLKKKGAIFVPPTDTLVVGTTLAGLGFDVDDFMDGSTNTIAFYTAEWYMDDQLQGRIRLDDIGYDETRYLNAYADYKRKQNNGYWLQCLFQLPGNRLGHIYESLNANSGVLNIADMQVHKVKAVFKDDEGNESTVQFYLRSEGKTNPLSCDPLFKANKINKIEQQPNISFTLDEVQLYDDICFTMDRKPDPNSFSDRYQVHSADVPLHHFFNLNIKPNKPVPFALREKIIFICNNGKSEDGSAVQQDDKGWYKGMVRNFGEYRLVADTTAPVITLDTKTINSKTTRIYFSVKDALTSVKKLEATLENGDWLLFEPTMNGKFYYRFDDGKCTPGKHTLKVTATDENDNKRTYTLNFTR